MAATRVSQTVRRAPVSSATSQGLYLPGLFLAAVAALILASIAGFQIATWDRIAPGVVVLGTSIGGLTTAEAAARLTPSTNALLARPLQLTFQDRTWATTARDLGLRLDPVDLAQSAYGVGRNGNPLSRLVEQVAVLVGGRDVSIGNSTDQSALDRSLAGIAQQVDQPPQDSRLTLSRDGQLDYQPSRVGLAVDIAASRDRVAQALAAGAGSVALVVRETQPTVSDDMVQPARDQVQRLVADDGQPPLTLTFGDQKWPLERADVLALLSIDGGSKPGQPATIKIDEAPLRALALKLAKTVNQDVQDARFQFVGGSLKVLRESKDGRDLDQDATVALIKSKLLAGERTAALPISVTKPAVSSDNPASLGIVEQIDRGSTSFAGSIPEKKHNIQLAAQLLNGVVVPPHGTFSFNKEVGPTTLEAGFQWGFGIEAGAGGAHTVPSVGGGICQVATTLFQPVFWAGYQLEERYWHLYWIPAYTSRGVVGLDVTVDPDSNLDFKWVNPTDNYVLVQSAADDQNVYFSLYGKKPSWKVEVEDAKITNRVPADARPTTEQDPTMPWGRTLPVETAREGFDVTVTRHVIPAGGGQSRDLVLKSSYQPSRTVTLIGTKDKPASASVQEMISKVLGTDKPAAPAVDNKPVGNASAQKTDATPQSAPTQPAAPTAAAAATKVPAAPAAGQAGTLPTVSTAPEPTAVPTKAAAAPAATAPPKPAATTAPVAPAAATAAPATAAPARPAATSAATHTP